MKKLYAIIIGALINIAVALTPYAINLFTAVGGLIAVLLIRERNFTKGMKTGAIVGFISGLGYFILSFVPWILPEIPVGETTALGVAIGLLSTLLDAIVGLVGGALGSLIVNSMKKK